MQFLTQPMIQKIKHMTFIPIRFMYGPGDKCGLLQIIPHGAPLYKPHHKGYYNVNNVTMSQVLHTHKYDYSFNEIKRMYEKQFSFDENISLGYSATFLPKQCLRGMQMQTFHQCTFPCTDVHTHLHNELLLATFSGNKKKYHDLVHRHKLIVQTADQYLIPNIYRTMEFIKTARWYAGEEDDLMYVLTYNKSTNSMECMMDFHREEGLDYHDFNLIELQKRLFYRHNLSAFAIIPVAALEFLSENQVKWIFDKEQDDLKGLATEEANDQLPMWEGLNQDIRSLIKARIFRDSMMAISLSEDNRKRPFVF